jgi:hypothetical protein
LSVMSQVAWRLQMGASWYVEKGGKRSGPFTPAQLRELVVSGRLQATDMVQNDGMEKAVLASKVKGLFPASVVQPAAPAAARPANVAPVQSDLKAAGKTGETQKQVTSGPPALPITEPASPSLRERFSKLPGWKKGVGAVGVCFLISIIAAVIMALTGVKPSNTIASKAKANSEETGQKESTKPGTEPAKTTEFSDVDYSFDFSKVDYSPPAGMKGTTRSGFVKEVPQNEDPGEKGKWERAEGYEDSDGKFVQHGKRMLWFDKDEKDKYKDQYWFKGKHHGVDQAWDKTGNKLLEWAYVDGMPHGVLTSWYNNGQKATVSHVIHGKPHGFGAKWYKDGQKKLEETLIDGQLHGTQKWWWPNGKMREETECVKGDTHGKYTLWNEEGTLITEGMYKQNERIGTWRLGFSPKGGGTVYYVQFQEGVPWNGGTKAEFLGRLANNAMQDQARGINLIIYPRTGECHCLVSHKWFIDTYGKPQQDRGRDQFTRVWAYQCTDGPLVLKAGIDPNRGIINLNTE